MFSALVKMKYFLLWSLLALSTLSHAADTGCGVTGIPIDSYGHENIWNSTFTPLDAGDTWLGCVRKNEPPTPYVLVQALSDVGGTLYADFSTNGRDFDSTAPVHGWTLKAGVSETHCIAVGSRFYRLRYTNGAVAQAFLRLGSYGVPGCEISLSFDNEMSANTDSRAVRIQSEIEIMQGHIGGHMIVQKYGINADVDAAEDIWDGGGDYTGFPLATPENFEIISTSTADDVGGTGAQTLRIFYLDDDYEMFDASGDELFIDCNLDGTTAVDCGTSGMRVWRAKVILSGSGQINAGIITIRWATTEAVIFSAIRVGTGQSEVSAFTIPAGYTGYLKLQLSSMNDKNANSADMAIKTREEGTNTYRMTDPFEVSTDHDHLQPYFGALRYAAKTDIVFRATTVSSANGIIPVSYSLMLVETRGGN